MSVAPGAYDKSAKGMSGIGLSYELPARAAAQACAVVACSHTWVDSSHPCQRSGVMVAGWGGQAKNSPRFRVCGAKAEFFANVD